MKRHGFIVAALLALLPETVFALSPAFMAWFDSGKSDLSQPGLNSIKQAASHYKQLKKSLIGSRIELRGHADRTEKDAMELSLVRANVVKDALIQEGVPASAITVIGRGDTQPLIDRAGDAQNLRVEIINFDY